MAVCFDAATGEELADYVGLAHALQEADQRAEQQSLAIEDQVAEAVMTAEPPREGRRSSRTKVAGERADEEPPQARGRRECRP